MNQSSFYSPAAGPYEDNPRFLKKIPKGYLKLMLAGLSVMEIAVLYFCLFFGMGISGDFINNREELLMAETMQKLESIGFLLLGVFLFLPFVTLVHTLLTFKDSRSNHFSKAGLHFLTVFLALGLITAMAAIVYDSSMTSLFFSVGSEAKDFYTGVRYVLPIACASVLPAFLYIMWAISGIVFSSSLKKTIARKGLITKGARPFALCSFFLAVVNVAEAVLLVADRITEGAVYGPVASDFAMFFQDITEKNLFAAGMVIVFLLAGTVVYFAAGRLASGYARAAEAAQRSINMSGINMYLNGDSFDNAYYSGYTAPGDPVPAGAFPAGEGSDDPAPVFLGRVEPEKMPENDFPEQADLICHSCGAKNLHHSQFCCRCGVRLY